MLVCRILLIHRQSRVGAAVRLDEDGRADDFFAVDASGGLRGADVAGRGAWEGVALTVAPDAFGDGTTACVR